ncbi:sulfate ABC transporter substrate-binding protein [Nocardioides sp. MAHUQ-72]|uniref:sulfate ABC transporter substrate-binding protein n=1 Tax=unclassified Nocardioides TaxID=2615069 RepID=UPI00361EA2DD
MKTTIKVAAALSVGVLALTGCSSDASGSDSKTLNLVGYSVLEQANAGVIKAFQDSDAGKDVDFKESYGASGDQSRAVTAGQDADEVHLSLEPDVTRLVDEGIVAKDWKDNDTQGICTQSIVVMVVQSGNPKNITSWSDLTKPGVGIVTPNPASSGSAKWNLLAAYGSVLADGGSDADAQQYMKDFFANVVALPDSGRDATTAFTGGTGDVLLSYENEAILARQSGTDFDYVVPDSSLLIQNPCALTDGAADGAQEFMDFQKSEAGQKLYAETGYRPLTDVGDVTVKGANDESDPFPEPATLLTIDKDFEGWSVANDKFFGDGEDGAPLGIITKIQGDSGQ